MFPSALLVSRTYREENEGEWSLLLTFAIVSSTPVLNFIRPLLLHHAYRTVFTRYYLIQIPTMSRTNKDVKDVFMRGTNDFLLSSLFWSGFSKTLRTKILLEFKNGYKIGSEISNNKKALICAKLR
jgi:hypothetical protein